MQIFRKYNRQVLMEQILCSFYRVAFTCPYFAYDLALVHFHTLPLPFHKKQTCGTSLKKQQMDSSEFFFFLT